jgi:hypothetical protein
VVEQPRPQRLLVERSRSKLFAAAILPIQASEAFSPFEKPNGQDARIPSDLDKPLPVLHGHMEKTALCSLLEMAKLRTSVPKFFSQ